MSLQTDKFSSEDVEGTVNKAVAAITAFRDEPTRDAAIAADLALAYMRLALGNRFDELGYFVTAEREIRRFLEGLEKKGETELI